MSVGEVGEFSTSAPAFVLAGDSVHFWEINSSGGKVRTIVFKISDRGFDLRASDAVDGATPKDFAALFWLYPE